MHFGIVGGINACGRRDERVMILQNRAKTHQQDSVEFAARYEAIEPENENGDRVVAVRQC
ncbi:MAG: hypothetical protein C0467_18380 [Planctomycetaceae bacterium]|nr:hypothetical protein [Planctomycetaceae bacterium]